MTSPLRWCVAATPDVLGLTRDLVDPGSLLWAVERERQAALVGQADRDDFAAARVLARIMVARQAGMTVDADALRQVEIRQVCANCGGPHGRPHVPGMPGTGLSWSHAHGWVAVAVGRGPVGVDVESVPIPTSSSAVREALGWVRAEALVKFGHADLDAARTWRLTGEPAPEGRRYRLPATASPQAASRITGRLGRTAVLADAVMAGVVGAVAAGKPAQRVDLEVSAAEAW